MVVRNGEGHELFQRHAVLGIGLEQRRRDRNEAQTLLHHLGVDEKSRGDFLLAHALFTKDLEGAELVERMKRRTLDILGQRDLIDQDVVTGLRDDTGTGVVLFRRFCLTKSSSAR